VGRVSGQYLPNDPLEYRRERQNEKNGTSLDSHKTKNFWSKVIADSTNDITSDRSKTSLLSNNDIESSYTDLLSHPPRKSDNKDSISDPVQESIRTNLKLEEFIYLVNKYFSPENASTILGLAAYHFSQGNDDFFEKSLLFLRELHGTSFDNSTTRRVSLEITYPHGIDRNLSLPKPENKDPAAEQTQAIGNRSVKAISSSGVYTESD